MNYTKVNWTDQTAITQDALSQMDNGISACAAKIDEINTVANKTKEMQIGSQEIRNGVSGVTVTVTGSNYSVLSKDITFPSVFPNKPIVVVSPLSARPDNIFVSASNVSTTGFTIHMRTNQPDTAIWAAWVAFGDR